MKTLLYTIFFSLFGIHLLAQSYSQKEWERLKEIFADPGLQMVSFTITEKGYALKDSKGEFFSFIREDIDNGPEKATSAMR